MSLPLDRLDHLPPRLAEISLSEIREIFPNPALIHVKGEQEPPLFVSTLLHGNETTSFHVLQYLAREYADKAPPRSLMIFVGNVEAAAVGARHLDHTPDFNRIWAQGDTPWHQMAREVLDAARQANIFASIDIHNNTGTNPLYGCVNTLRPADQHLASIFSDVGVYYLNPPTTQSIAFSHLCPAITVECGKSGNEEGIGAAISLVDTAMRLEHFPAMPPEASSFELYETIGRVTVAPDASLSFGEAGADIVLRDDLEALNFVTVPKGDVWARTKRPGHPLKVSNEHGEDLTDDFFRHDGEDIRLNCDVVPSMVTPDEEIIRQDCLCYLMKRI